MQDKPKNSPSRGILLAVALILIIISIVITALAISELTATTPAQDETQYNYDGSTPIEPSVSIGDFALTNQRGESVSVADLQGKPSLIFFGFTHCPDVCPTTMSEYKAIQRDLGAKGADVNYVFISVDGERDTPEVIGEFFRVKQIEDFIGLTGTPEDVLAAGEIFGLQVEFDAPDANGAYNIVHTPSIFLLDASGKWVMKYAFGIDYSVIVEDLEGML